MPQGSSPSSSPLLPLLLGIFLGLLGLGCTTTSHYGDDDASGDDDDDATGDDDDDATGDDDDATSDPTEADINTVTLVSPTADTSLSEGVPVSLEARVKDGQGHPVTPPQVAWSSSLTGDLGVAALSGQALLDGGTQTLTVTIGYEDGSSEFATVEVNVASPSPHTGHWQGPLQVDVAVLYEGDVYNLECNGNVSMDIDAAGQVVGSGQCTIDVVVEEYDIPFGVEGLVTEGGAFDGLFAITNPDDGTEYSVDSPGTFSGDSGTGTFTYSDPPSGMDGVWTVHRS